MKLYRTIIISLSFILLITVGCEKLTIPTETNNGQVKLAKKGTCITIQDGILKYQQGHYLAGKPLTTGFDIFGYNYQSRMFKGSYANVYLGGDGFPPYDGNDAAYITANPNVVTKWYWQYRTTKLEMKWNDSWLSTTDCDGDGKLDRHYGFSSYLGSGAWLTNHQSDEYVDNGKTCNWNDFVKIVAAPSDASQTGGVWYNSSGVEIGPVIWGEFALIQEIYNDPCAGYKGKLYVSPAGPGFGKY